MTSGIGNAASTLPWQAQVKSVASHPLLFSPGTKTLYSDTNFNLLGELIQQRSGESYGTFIQNQILGPLGMSQTQELGKSATVPNQAVGYDAARRGSWPKAAHTTRSPSGARCRLTRRPCGPGWPKHVSPQ